jgi:ABC-type uncharacterized transport system fused permease/ATPase subunit
VSGDHQNPEFRIADDVRGANESPVDFVIVVVSALSAITFIAVLWSIHDTLEFSLGGYHLGIPGFLVAGAAVYALIASGSMVLIGRRFVSASEAKNRTEAEYRDLLTRLRENGKSIALIGGEKERAGADRSLKKVRSAWRNICARWCEPLPGFGLGERKIEIRRGAKVFFLPQRPYMPIGSLRRAVTCPDPAESRASGEIADVSEDVGLDHLVERSPQ